MPDKEQEKLSVILARIKEIGDTSYDGKVIDNILNIFADLTLSEQRALLKNLITICFIIQDQVLDNAASIAINRAQIQANKQTIEQVKKDMTEIETEINDIDTYNRLELIKLKSWLVKAIVVFIFVAAIGFIAFTAFTGGSNSITTIIKDVFDIIKEIIG